MTDVVPSLSIENLVNQRAGVMQRLQQAVELLREAASIAQVAHLGMPRIVVKNGYGGGRSDEVQLSDAYTGVDRDGATWPRGASAEDAVLKTLRASVDCAAWQWLMHQSGLRSLMDHQAREKWDEAVSAGDVPELTAENVRATFRSLHAGRQEMFERGVLQCFKALSWDHKTNLPQKFGKRLVLTWIRTPVSGAGGSLGSVNYRNVDRLDDLSRVFHVLERKPEPDHRNGWYGRLSAVRTLDDGPAEDDYLSVRCFRNGNAHVTLKRADLVEQMNKILARHYPGALPEPK